MITQIIPRLGAFDIWRKAARNMLAQGIPPEQISWADKTTQSPLFSDEVVTAHQHSPVVRVPKDFLELAKKVVAHKNGNRFARLYQVLWRLRTDPGVLGNPSDPDVHHLQAMAKSINRDCHKMKAFVRFRELSCEGGRRQFGAWFEPEHYVLELTAPFFARRFADMDWIISTPFGIAQFMNNELSYREADGERHGIADATEDLWRTYFSHIFNPARLKVKAMQSEMPKKYWKNLPEAALIPGLIANAEKRAQEMQDRMPTLTSSNLAKIKAPTVAHAEVDHDKFKSIDELRNAAIHCQRCALHCHATQTVFGEGNNTAEIMFVGEQPGDQEDIAGKPFIGPAGQIFADALRAAAIDRSQVYVTNAVKHFKFSPRGKRRMHQRPNQFEIMACKWWLGKELQIIKPRLVVAMGSTALYALSGDGKNLTTRRGKFERSGTGLDIFVTFHPSAILRNPSEADAIRSDFYADFTEIAKFARK